MIEVNSRVICMQPKDRRNYIMEQLYANGKIDIEELVEELNVSAMTIRRDLNYLEENKKIIRTHGGAILNKALLYESSFIEKENKNRFEKQQIAKEAVKMINEGSTIILDSGTTTFEIAKLLKTEKNITVITNDIKIATELMNSQVKVIITGGELQNNIGALFGPLAEYVISNLHVDLFFLGAHAVHLDAGVTAPTFEKAVVKKLMIDAADVTWLVADSSKFNEKSLTKVCQLSDIDGVITDDRLAKQYKNMLQEQVRVVTAKGAN